MKRSPAENFRIAEETLDRLSLVIDELHALCCLVELARVAEIEGADMCGYDRKSCDWLIQRAILRLANQCQDVFCDHTEQMMATGSFK